ncbi:hypothetical protein [Bartonella sp. MR63HLJHH]
MSVIKALQCQVASAKDDFEDEFHTWRLNSKDVQARCECLADGMYRF